MCCVVDGHVQSVGHTPDEAAKIIPANGVSLRVCDVRETVLVTGYLLVILSMCWVRSECLFVREK